jgi:hypothetical protein
VIKQECLEFLMYANRDIITLFVQAVFGDDRATSDVYRDTVRTIILSKVSTNLLEGNYNTKDWLDKPGNNQPSKPGPSSCSDSKGPLMPRTSTWLSNSVKHYRW